MGKGERKLSLSFAHLFLSYPQYLNPILKRFLMDRDTILLLHPFIAAIVVFPLIGIVVNHALQTRQRRLQVATGAKSAFRPVQAPNTFAWVGG
jgi:hypothetical protein